MSQLDRPPQSFDISTAMAMFIPPTNTIRLLSSSLLHHRFWNIIAIVNHHHHFHLISSVLIIKISLPSIIIRLRSGFVWWLWMVEVRRGVGRTQDSAPTQSCSLLTILLPPGESGSPKIWPITRIATYPRYMVFQRIVWSSWSVIDHHCDGHWSIFIVIITLPCYQSADTRRI